MFQVVLFVTDTGSSIHSHRAVLKPKHLNRHQLDGETEIVIREDPEVETSEGSGGKFYSLEDVFIKLSIIRNDAAEVDECVKVRQQNALNVQPSC